MAGKIAIFIPAYNEERSIGTVALLAKKYGAVTVVDDGSDDGTAEIARLAGARVVAHKKNRGYGAALKTAVAHAKKTGAEVIVIMDGDFQHDPKEIPVVCEPVLSGRADVCVGSRFLGKTVRAPYYRKTGVIALNALSSLHAGGKQMDYQSGFRALSRRAVEAVEIGEEDYSACSEMIERLVKKGMYAVEMPATIRYFDEPKKTGAVAHGAGVAKYALGAIARHKPLLFFAGLGTVLIFASLFAGIFVLDVFYTKGVLPIGSAFLTVFFGISGLVLLLIGINIYTLQAVLQQRGK
ncbi:MAG: glycosyltransferase family 2 protein [Candidatus Micrarchaeia archaeon]